jgi:hypothetical protein
MNSNAQTIYALSYNTRTRGLGCRIVEGKAGLNRCKVEMLRDANPAVTVAVSSLINQGKVDEAWDYWLEKERNAADSYHIEEHEISAAPVSENIGNGNGHGNGSGLSLRDRFAAMAPAIPEWFEEPTLPPPDPTISRSWSEEKAYKADKVIQQRSLKFLHVTSWAYAYADAMIKQATAQPAKAQAHHG